MNYGINFGHNRKWSAHSDAGLMAEAKNEALPLIMRLNSLAKSRVNRNGHAEFGPGEIASILGIGLRQNVTKLIKKAVSVGLLLEGSGQRCVLISGLVVQKNTGTGSCKHHNIDKSGNEIIEDPKFDVVTGEIYEEDESPVCPSEELVVPEVQVVIPAPENPTVDQDDTILDDEEDIWNDADVILAGAVDRRLATNKYYNPAWRTDLKDDILRATRAVEYANDESNKLVTVSGDDW